MMYSNGDHNTYGYNHIIAMSNHYHIQQEWYQSLQDYRDQLTADRKVCDLLRLRVGTFINGANNILKRMHMNNPTKQQKADEEKKAFEEHHAILLLLGRNNYKYG